MLENQLAPGLMRLKTKLSQGITTRPEGSIGERISKSDHLPHFKVVPEEAWDRSSIQTLRTEKAENQTIIYVVAILLNYSTSFYL